MYRIGLTGFSAAALVAGVLLSGFGAVAQEDVVSKRSEAMKAAGKNMFGTLGQMSRDRKPYEQAEVDAALTELEKIGGNIGALYPESSKGVAGKGDYSASPKVWDDKAGFEARIADFNKAVTDQKGKITSLDQLKAAFPAMSRTCSGCHETFRLKNG